MVLARRVSGMTLGFGLSRTQLLAVGFFVIAIGLRNTMQPLFQPLSAGSHRQLRARSIAVAGGRP